MFVIIRFLLNFAAIYAFFLPSAWADSVVVKRVPVQLGIYKYKNCVPSESKVPFGNCLCRAEIYKPVISGVNPVVANKINGFFNKEVTPRYLEGRSHNSCEGVPVETKDWAQNSRSYGFQVDLNGCSVLAISASGYYYNYGLPHGNGYSNSHIFNLATGEKYTYRQLFGDDLERLNLFLTKEAEHKHKKLLYDWLIAKMKEEPDNVWVPMKDIDKKASRLFVTKDGLDMRFDVLPYVAGGTLSISLPLKYIKDKNIRECLEKKYSKAIK